MTKPTTSPTPSSLVGTDLEGIFLQFLESEFSADALTESADFIPTDAARTIIARLKLAQAEKFAFALVHGPAGAGKSSATRWYARSYGCVLLHAQPQYDPSALLDDLAVNLRITRTRVFRQMVSMVRDRLQQKPLMIVVDEAQRCPRNTFETMKFLADETQSTFAIVTTDEFVTAVRNWRDIESRIGVVAGIGPISLAEFSELYRESGFTNATLEEIHGLAGGIMRDVVRLMRQIDHVIALNADRGMTRSVVTPKIVRAAATKLNLSGGRQ